MARRKSRSSDPRNDDPHHAFLHDRRFQTTRASTGYFRRSLYRNPLFRWSALDPVLTVREDPLGLGVMLFVPARQVGGELLGPNQTAAIAADHIERFRSVEVGIAQADDQVAVLLVAIGAPRVGCSFAQ